MYRFCYCDSERGDIMQNRTSTDTGQGQDKGVTVAYLRVSTEEQAREGVSLAAQREAVEAFARARGETLAAVYVDAGASGSTLDRPGLADMLAAVDAGGVACVVTFKVDRLSRSQRDLWATVERMQEAGTGLASVTEPIDTTSPSGRAMLGMLGVFAQMERETLAERTRAGMAQVKREGRHCGRVPYGFRLDPDARPGTLVADPDEQRTIAAVAAMRAEGSTLAAIARVLNASGYRTRSGARFRSETVRRLVATAAAVDLAAA